jgi:hypothetical protein
VPNWTLLHMRSPLNTTSGTGQYGELTVASSRSLSFTTDGPAELSFNMPGNHPQTALITPLVDDVLVFRDNDVIQRFRVVTRSLSKDSGVLQAQFSAVSYPALLDALIMHDGDTRSWATATEQSLIAWTILNQGQVRPFGDLAISRGTTPARSVTRVLQGTADESTAPRPAYFLSGTKRGDAINQLAQFDDGFEWDIEPSETDPTRSLNFNTWNFGSRNQHTTRSPLILDDGGSMANWSHTVTPSDYANLIRFTGAETTDENGKVKAVPILPAWYPGQNPTGTPPEGRWERDINNSDLTTQAAVNAAAPREYDAAHLYVPEISCTLRRGRWEGPSQLWLGDNARLIITEPVAGSPDDYIIYVDEDVRVVEINVDVDDLGAEDVSLSLNRRAFSTKRNTRRVNDRLTRLERR